VFSSLKELSYQWMSLRMFYSFLINPNFSFKIFLPIEMEVKLGTINFLLIEVYLNPDKQ